MRKERKEIGKGRERERERRRRRVFRICCGFDHLLGRRCFHGLIELKFCQHVLNSWIWFYTKKKGVWMSQLQATLS